MYLSDEIVFWSQVVCVQASICPLTGSWSGQQGDDEGQAQAGDMSRYHRRPPEPHIEPVVPHPQPLSHRAVFHIRRHAAGPPARSPAHSGGCRRCAETERRGGASAVGTLYELHHGVKVEEPDRQDRDMRSDYHGLVAIVKLTLHTMTLSTSGSFSQSVSLMGF